MAERVLNSPGTLDREIDQSIPNTSERKDTAACVIGTALKGPAFVPTLCYSMDEFRQKYGNLNPYKFGPYAVDRIFKNRAPVAYIRTLGAGANTNSSDNLRTDSFGVSKNAGLVVNLNQAPLSGGTFFTQDSPKMYFLVHKAVRNAAALDLYPELEDNTTLKDWASTDPINFVSAVLFVAKETEVYLYPYSTAVINTLANKFSPVIADGHSQVNLENDFLFKLAINYTGTDGTFPETYKSPGVIDPAEWIANTRVVVISFNPDSDHYIGKVLNGDPLKFGTEKHLLYADFPVDPVLLESPVPAGSDHQVILAKGRVDIDTGGQNSAVSGLLTSDEVNGGDPSAPTWHNCLGRFDSRFLAPSSTWFISQPYGTQEYDLFAFETLDDGEYANSKYKISITTLKRSQDASYPYPEFTVQIRDWKDNDLSPIILEEYVGCNLDSNSSKFIGRLIGDRKVYYNFDASDPKERRLIEEGSFTNKSTRVRVIVSSDVTNKRIPESAMPFGFRGLPTLKTVDLAEDGVDAWKYFDDDSLLSQLRLRIRDLAATEEADGTPAVANLLSAILPPVPFVHKITTGSQKVLRATTDKLGEPGDLEIGNSKLYWGVKFGRVLDVGNTNSGISEENRLFKSLSKFLGISKLDLKFEDRAADNVHDNKFTLARVAFPTSLSEDSGGNTVVRLDGAMEKQVVGLAYVRNGVPDINKYTIDDGRWMEPVYDQFNNPIGSTSVPRITFATLAAETNPFLFNKFSQFAKFTTFIGGGWDGLNILDRDAQLMNDRSTSTYDDGTKYGGAATDYVTPGFQTGSNINGAGLENNNIISYRSAIDIATDIHNIDVDLLTIPGIRDAFVTDYAREKVQDYGYSFYVMDVPGYDVDRVRLFDDDLTHPHVDNTLEAIETRMMTTNSTGAYFPDIVITDPDSGRNIVVPSSIAAIAALSYTDKVSDPWFAPAGFNRGALDFVNNVDVRLSADDRDAMETVRINPVGIFTNETNPRLKQYVIFGQNTFESHRTSALTKVNVKRLEIAIKRVVKKLSNGFVFENNTPKVRADYKAKLLPFFALVYARSGIKDYGIIVDDSNNKVSDVENYQMNVSIWIVPVRAIEKIYIDFVVNSQGQVNFV